MTVKKGGGIIAKSLYIANKTIKNKNIPKKSPHTQKKNAKKTGGYNVINKKNINEDNQKMTELMGANQVRHVALENLEPQKLKSMIKRNFSNNNRAIIPPPRSRQPPAPRTTIKNKNVITPIIEETIVPITLTNKLNREKIIKNTAKITSLNQPIQLSKFKSIKGLIGTIRSTSPPKGHTNINQPYIYKINEKSESLENATRNAKERQKKALEEQEKEEEEKQKTSEMTIRTVINNQTPQQNTTKKNNNIKKITYNPLLEESQRKKAIKTRKNTLGKYIQDIKTDIEKIQNKEAKQRFLARLNTIKTNLGNQKKIQNIRKININIGKIEDAVGSQLSDERRIAKNMQKNAEKNQINEQNNSTKEISPENYLALSPNRKSPFTATGYPLSQSEPQQKFSYRNNPMGNRRKNKLTLRTTTMPNLRTSKTNHYTNRVNLGMFNNKKKMNIGKIKLEAEPTVVESVKPATGSNSFGSTALSKISPFSFEKNIGNDLFNYESNEELVKQPLTTIEMTDKNIEELQKQLETKAETEKKSDPSLLNKAKSVFSTVLDKFTSKKEPSPGTGPIQVPEENTIDSLINYLSIKKINFLNIFGDVYSIDPKTKEIRGALNNITKFAENFDIKIPKPNEDISDFCKTLLAFATVFGVKRANFSDYPLAQTHCRLDDDAANDILKNKLDHYTSILKEKMSMNVFNKKTNKVVEERIRRVGEYIDFLGEATGKICTIENRLSCDEVGLVTSTETVTKKGCPCPEEMEAIKKLLAALIKKGNVKNIDTSKMTFESLLEYLQEKSADPVNDEEDAVKTLKANVEALKAQVTGLKDALKNEITTSLRTSIVEDIAAKQAQGDSSAAEQKTAELQETNKYEAEIADLKTKIEALEQNSQKTEEAKAELDAKIKEYTDALAKIAADSQGIINEKISEFEKKLTDETIKGLVSEALKAQDMQPIIKEIVDAAIDIENIKKELQSADTTTIENRLPILENKIGTQEFNQAISDLRQELSWDDAKITSVVDKITPILQEQVNEQMKNFNQRLGDQDTKIDGKLAEFNTARDTIENGIRAEFEGRFGPIDEKLANLEKIHAQLDDHEKRLVVLEQKKAELADQKADQSEIDAVQSEIQAEENQKVAAVNQFTGALNEFKNIVTENNKQKQFTNALNESSTMEIPKIKTNIQSIINEDSQERNIPKDDIIEYNNPIQSLTMEKNDISTESIRGVSTTDEKNLKKVENELKNPNLTSDERNKLRKQQEILNLETENKNIEQEIIQNKLQIEKNQDPMKIAKLINENTKLYNKINQNNNRINKLKQVGGGSSPEILFELLAEIAANPDLDIDAELANYNINPTEAVPIVYFMQELIAATE